MIDVTEQHNTLLSAAAAGGGGDDDGVLADRWYHAGTRAPDRRRDLE